jgi:hypothetical protein
VSTPGRTDVHDVVLRLLDHQLVGPDGALLGNVDDLELAHTAEGWLVTGVMVGPAALSQRLPGRLGDWLYAVWRRLHAAEDPTAVVLPIEHVVRIDSAVHVDERGAHALTLTFGLELWLREHVVGRLPGAREAGGKEPRRGAAPRHHERAGDVPPRPARAPLHHARGLGSVLGRPVQDAEGNHLGRVTELRCSGRPRGERQVPLRVESVLYGPHPLASELGYGVGREQGPAVVRGLVRRWQRHDRIVDVAQLERLGDADGTVRLRAAARPRRPRES